MKTLVTEDMKAQMLRRMAALRAQHPDKNITLDWDFNSVIRGVPRMVTRVKVGIGEQST